MACCNVTLLSIMSGVVAALYRSSSSNDRQAVRLAGRQACGFAGHRQTGRQTASCWSSCMTPSATLESRRWGSGFSVQGSRRPWHAGRHAGRQARRQKANWLRVFGAPLHTH